MTQPTDTTAVDGTLEIASPPTVEIRPDTTTQAAPIDLAGRRVVLLNEWFETTGGAERVLLTLRSALPDAETLVLWSDRDLQDYPGIRESWLARTPLRGHKALALPLMPLVWRTQTRERYDVVLSLSHSLNHCAKLPLNPGGAHLSYIHTPARYLWMREIDTRRTGGTQALAVAAPKRLERATSSHVTRYAANSETVRLRIARFWQREARVIHPPVRTLFLADAPEDHQHQGRDYLLGLGRWVGYKRFDFMITVAERAGLPLIIAGGGPMEGQLRQLALTSSAEVRFEPRPDDTRVRELLWGAQCLLSPGIEDFGITAVEAQACGTPVIGIREGGLLETVIDGETGCLVHDLDPCRFAEAARRARMFEPARAMQNAGRFSEASFQAAVLRWIDETMDS